MTHISSRISRDPRGIKLLVTHQKFTRHSPQFEKRCHSIILYKQTQNYTHTKFHTTMLTPRVLFFLFDHKVWISPGELARTVHIDSRSIFFGHRPVSTARGTPVQLRIVTGHWRTNRCVQRHAGRGQTPTSRSDRTVFAERNRIAQIRLDDNIVLVIIIYNCFLVKLVFFSTLNFCI